MKRIRQKSIKFLWEQGSWDGPYSGFCEYRGRNYYFTARDMGDEETRKLFLYPISDEHFAYNHYMHKMFSRHVGFHMELREDNIFRTVTDHLWPFELHDYWFGSLPGTDPKHHCPTVKHRKSYLCNTPPENSSPIGFFFLFEKD